MDKLVERDNAPRASSSTAAPALAVQFFLIPLAVVAVVVGIYAGFRMLLADERSAQDYLNDIRAGGRERRWPAAYELSRLMADPEVQADPTLGPALLKAFLDSKDDDPRIRRYLALAIGRLKSPPPQTASLLLGALDDADTETRISAIWALGSLGDPDVVPHLEKIYADSQDAGVRKVAVYALGALPGDAQCATLCAALNDSVPDVQWNAAIALARHGRRDGVAVLGRMLDRDYVRRNVTRSTDATSAESPVDQVMIGALRAVGALREWGLRPQLVALSRDDPSLRVRQAAIDALKQFER